MSVVVPDGMPIDQALKLLWREAIREDIPNVIRKTQYYIKEAEKKHNKKKLWKKTKKKRRAHRRKIRRKGILRRTF
ncbi:30S ribosomal protein S21 [Candidatus Dojkabacteria bacterium]|nr:30S ribosomal protein S21 [Candidatus Dojkabacteria bacterium]